MDVDAAGLVVRFPGGSPTRGPALDGLELRVAEGEHVALLGPSGSGKTTLLRVLLGAVPPAGGRVRVGGRDPFGSREELVALRRATGLVRQGGDLVEGLSARTNALAAVSSRFTAADWWALLRGEVPPAQRERLLTLAHAQGIAELLDAPVRTLSGGQRQRVALVRALLGGPRLLLADEPTSGLDPAAADAAVTALRQVSVTLLLATHDLGVAARFPRVVALRAGRVVHDGSGLDAAAAALVYGGPA